MLDSNLEGRVAYLHKVAKEGLSKEITFMLRPEE